MRKMNRKIQKRIQEDMPPCSYPECGASGTHLIVTKLSLAIYKKTKDRKDIRFWVGCATHHSLIAHGVKWAENVDVQVMTAEAILHLGEAEEVPNGSSDPDATTTP